MIEGDFYTAKRQALVTRWQRLQRRSPWVTALLYIATLVAIGWLLAP